MLAGRDREEKLLDGVLADARAGRSGVLAFVGEVGIGKSALLERADAMAGATGMNVLRARGIQSEARIPFAGLFEVLRPALDRLDRVAQPQREALEAALALRPARTQDRFAIGAATLSLLAAYADEAPLLVLIDDAHWLDGSSTAALLFALRRLVADSVAVVLSVRTGEASLLEGTDLPVHRLDGLDRAATVQLVTAQLGTSHLGTDRPGTGQASGDVRLSDDLIDRLHRGTGGNPLALIELAHDGTAAMLSSGDPVLTVLPVGDRIARAYVARCATLDQPARDMLLLAAVNDVSDLSVLEKAADHAGLDVRDLAAAEAIGLIAVVGDRVQFQHPLVRSSVYADAPADHRRLMHRTLATSLPDAEADRRAWHLALAAIGADGTASSALEQAAARARARSAYDVASHAFERAAALAPIGTTTDGTTADGTGRRGALLFAAADSAWLGGLATRAVALIDAARSHPSQPDIAVLIEHLRGHIATRLGPVGDALQILLDGAALAAPVDPERAVVMLAEAVNAAFYAGDVAAMQVAAARIGPLIDERSTRRARFFAAIARGMVMIFGGEGDHGASLVRTAVALVEESDELADDPRLLAWAAMGPLWLRESDAGHALADRAMRVARQQSAVGVLPFLLSHVAIDDAASDRWVQAIAGFNEAIDLARESGQRSDLAFALARLAWLEARQGRKADCQAHAEEARVLAQEIGLGLTEIWRRAALGDLHLALGQIDDALAQFEGLRALLADRGVGDADLSPEPELVELYLRKGQPGQAAAHLATFERMAAAKGQPWALARAARSRGLLAPNDDLDRHFDLALAWHGQTPDVFETARTQLAYGGRLRRARQRIRARDHLHAARAGFDRLGATPWSDAARAELAATGETARRRDPSTGDQLTPQELQIALLLASGQTTREAAAGLFLSPKTIEYHLRSIYRKLAINSRAELTATMADTRTGP